MKTRINLIIGLFALAFCQISSLNAQQKVSIIPDRIILNIDGDPATGMAVTWRTSAEVQAAKAQITEANASPSLAETSQSFTALTQELSLNEETVLFHSVSFTGLKPKTLYAYRVGSDQAWSEWFHFKTASENPEPFSFIYLGDAQNDIKSLWSRVIRKAFSDLPHAALILHAGDLIDGRNLNDEWAEWHYAGSFINGMIPSLSTPGNHEYYIPNMQQSLNPFWQPGFTLPLNGPEGFEETVYFVDYQGVRFISLNSMEALMREESAKIQAEWLEQVLENNPNQWTIAFFHHPVFSTARNRDNVRVRTFFKPLFDKYKVDLVLQGHDHTYARGVNLTEGVQRTEANEGTVYVVSVSGPKMYEQSSEPWWKVGTTKTQLYQLLDVENDRIRYRSFTATGELFDSFEIVKRKDQSNLVVEGISNK